MAKLFFGEHDIFSNSIVSSYIAKMDAGGNFIWVKNGTGGANDYSRGFGLSMDNEGYVCGNGFFSGSFSFGENTVTATGGPYDFDAYIVRYDSEGEFKWLNKAGGYGNDQGFDLFTDKLSEQGVVAKTGSMVDASFVDVPRQRNSKGGNDTIKAGGVPIEFGKNKHKLAQKDTNARWAKKNQETHFGYKNHVNVDERSKLINKYCVSSASKHDSQLLEDLVDKDDKQLYADSAYRSEDIERYLRGIKCKSQVHEKGARNNPLSEQQKSNNHKKSKTRVRVEHVFGFMTNSMHDGLHMRQIGQQRIKSCIGLLNLTYNLFRYEQIVRLKVS